MTSGASGTIGSPLPKWQLALAVGAPVAALGLGFMYYKSSTKAVNKQNRSKQKEAINGSADKQISIDGDVPSRTDSTESTSETLLKEAQKYKAEGNKLFKAGKYDEAIAQYNEAILLCPKDQIDELSKFYQNRAASYERLEQYQAVKDDCTNALKLNPQYVKALVRRATALEKCKELESSLDDLTTACILERYLNKRTLTMVDSILNKLGKQHVEEHMKNRKPVMPSKHFITTYFRAFNSDPIYSKLDELSKDDSYLSKAVKALKEEKFDDIISLCSEEINRHDKSVEESVNVIKARLLRGSFYILIGQHENATTDLNAVIDNPSVSDDCKVNALIKRATMYMQLENAEQTYKDLELAEKIDPNCEDIYSNRGQINIILENMEDAKRDFQKAVDLNPNHGLVYVQKSFIDFQYALTKQDRNMITNALKDYENLFKRFPDCIECYIIYAQMMAEMQEFRVANKYYKQALEIDPKNATIYVRRGMLELQWTGNVEKGVEYLNKALELDDKCETGFETLGTIEVQRGNLKEGIALFDKALQLCRTRMELAHIFGLKNAAKSQLTVAERLGGEFMRNLSLLP